MAQGGTVGYHVLVLCMPDQIKLAKNLKALCGSCLDAKLFDKRETHARHLVEASLPDNTEANREVYAKAYIDQKEARAELANLVVERREFAEHKRIFQAQDAVYEKTKRDLQVDWGILPHEIKFLIKSLGMCGGTTTQFTGFVLCCFTGSALLNRPLAIPLVHHPVLTQLS
jgi:hypothetical protein